MRNGKQYNKIRELKGSVNGVEYCNNSSNNKENDQGFNTFFMNAIARPADEFFIHVD